MNRASFLKSLAVLVATPSLLGTAASQSITLPKKQIIKSFAFKLTAEMREDDGYMKSLFYNRNSVVWRGCLQAGIDLTQPFNWVIGYDRKDFTKNLLTCKITQ